MFACTLNAQMLQSAMEQHFNRQQQQQQQPQQPIIVMPPQYAPAPEQQQQQQQRQQQSDGIEPSLRLDPTMREANSRYQVGHTYISECHMTCTDLEGNHNGD